MNCKSEGCDRPANVPGSAKGLCVKHYRQHLRGRLGKVRERSAPGEGDELTFRLPAEQKRKLEKLAKRGGVPVAELLRQCVRDLLGE